MLTTDILILGGGLMGCSTAFALAREGASVLVAERREAPGRETTARSGAICRAHYGVPDLVALAVAAQCRYQRFADEVGGSCGWTACGYAVMVDKEDAPTLRASVAMQKALGANVVLIGPNDLRAMVPSLMVGDVALAAWEPDGGFCDPAMTVASYAAAAQRLGAVFRHCAPARAAERTRGGWRVTLGDGETVEAGQVILATGNWSRPVGGLFGVDLPVTPVRAQIVVLDRPQEFSGAFPVLSDLIHLAYYRMEGANGMWAGSSDMADLQEALPVPEGYDEAGDAPAVEAARRKASLRFEGLPVSENGGVQRAFAGLYETTPDWQPIMDSFGDGLHAAVGFSGHGFKLGPVVGEAMAARALGRPDSFEISLFAASRFAEDRPIRSQYPYQRAKFLR